MCMEKIGQSTEKALTGIYAICSSKLKSVYVARILTNINAYL